MTTDSERAEPTGEEFLPEEEEDLVALLDADDSPRRYYLPAGKDPETGAPRFSETYYIEAKAWTAAEAIRYRNTGVDVFMPRDQERAAAAPEARFRADGLLQAQVLIDTSVVGYCVRLKGRDYSREAGKPGQAPWGLLCQLRPAVMNWIVARLLRHHGLTSARVVEKGSGPGEA